MHAVSPSLGAADLQPDRALGGGGCRDQAAREHRWTSLGTALVVIVGGYWVVIARYGSTGGSSYGARMWTDVLPVFVYLAVPVLGVVRRAWADRTRAANTAVAVAAGAVVIWSVGVNATGAVLRSGYCLSATPVHVDEDPSRVWDWSDPQFARAVPARIAGRVAANGRAADAAGTE